jgi:hypothetical protein
VQTYSQAQAQNVVSFAPPSAVAKAPEAF